MVSTALLEPPLEPPHKYLATPQAEEQSCGAEHISWRGAATVGRRGVVEKPSERGRKHYNKS